MKKSICNILLMSYAGINNADANNDVCIINSDNWNTINSNQDDLNFRVISEQA